MLNLEQITAELEARRMALPVEVALHITVEVLRAATWATREIGSTGPIALCDVTLDPSGRVHVCTSHGSGSDPDLVGSLSQILLALLSGERGLEPSLRALADEGVSDNVIRILARARAGRYPTPEAFLEAIERWIDLHRMWVTSELMAEILRRHQLVDRSAA